MIRRLYLRLVAPAVLSDADRLVSDLQGSAAALVRQILSTPHARCLEAHWRRVLVEVERRYRYSPQRRP